MIPCDYCHTNPAKPKGRFCSDKCRSAWHHENRCPGVVKGLRALKRGWAVTVYYPTQPSGINIGTMVVLETPQTTRSDAFQGDAEAIAIP